MTWAIKADVSWLQAHGVYRDAIWRCRETTVPILSTIVVRTVTPTDVRPVQHFYCPSCMPKWLPPEYAAPLYEGELVTVTLL